MLTLAETSLMPGRTSVCRVVWCRRLVEGPNMEGPGVSHAGAVPSRTMKSNLRAHAGWPQRGDVRQKKIAARLLRRSWLWETKRPDRRFAATRSKGSPV